MMTTRRTLLAGLPAAMAPAPAALRLPRKIRVGLIGLEGHVGEVLNPLPQLPDVEICALAHDDAEAIARYKKNPGVAIAKVYDDPRRMLDTEKPDVVAVCNVFSEHAAAVLDCLARGIHVVAEKPIATELSDLEKIRKALERGPAKLVSMLPMRYSPPYKALKQIVDSGEIGDVVQIDAQKSYKESNRRSWWYKRATYGGTIPWIGIHMIDLMLFTTGRNLIETCSYQNHIGSPHTGDTENITASVFRMDNGGVALLRMDYLRPQSAPTHGDDRLRLAGTKGVAEYMAFTGVTVVSNARTHAKITQLPGEGSLFADFLDSVYNNKPPTMPWSEIYRGHQIVLGARQSAEQHRIVRL